MTWWAEPIRRACGCGSDHIGALSMTADTGIDANVRLYALIGVDRPGAFARRAEIVDEHRAYVRANKSHIRVAGPFLDADGNQVGSLIVFEVADPQYVWDWIRNEPFYQDGVY